ncbi:hypothetical protein JRO89_XS04G0229700 [Xanthoceras sorbifolium]|uniref:Uncharacterized protein n=1 Tax=Xanthoceras sorbifolium TaxID=99658 RepID=A0ABQ8I6N6_9ROSI|nr:hypothetical protein JRO89_XS04G0229700 [Xanthoceras sorbifolium]
MPGSKVAEFIGKDRHVRSVSRLNECFSDSDNDATLSISLSIKERHDMLVQKWWKELRHLNIPHKGNRNALLHQLNFRNKVSLLYWVLGLLEDFQISQRIFIPKRCSQPAAPCVMAAFSKVVCCRVSAEVGELIALKEGLLFAK